MPETFTEFFLRCGREKFDVILFDIDGTLAAGGRPLPGARELLLLLERENFPFLLLTNDCCSSRKEKAAMLQKKSIPVSEEQIYSCGDVLKLWKKNSNYKGELFYRCGRLGNPDYAEAAGIKVTSELEALPRCQGVIWGEGAFDWREVFEGIFNFFLTNPEAPLVVVNPDSCWPSSRHSGLGIGSGAQARFICTILKENGISVEPVYIGKPYPLVYQSVAAELEERFGRKIAPERIAMVGDSLASDIQGANANGLCSCLVLSGITDLSLAAAAPEERKPRLIFSGV